MNVAPAFVARGEPAEPVDPGEAAFDHPSVAAQLLTGLDAASCDAGSDPATAASLLATSMVVGLVGVELVWSASRPATLPNDRRDAVEQFLKGRLSLVLAPVRTKASGRPFLSVIRWRFVPSLPLSVGFGPVLSPPFWQRVTRCPCRPGSSRSGRLPVADGATHSGVHPRRLHPASPADGASR